ncbi:MAG: hypothetical protein JXA14_15135 [Anaerolineae bacterium]|nr:hypothetical protein [Anaerolineae bacterium]
MLNDAGDWSNRYLQMLVRFLCTIFLVTLLAGCVPAKPTVSPAAISEFMEVVERGEYHAMTRKGKEVFEEGLCIPDHTELFAEFPRSEMEPGHIRYVFYSFDGEASGGEVYLILDRDSGEIVEFNYFEVTYE